MREESDFLKWFEYANRDFSTANYLIEGNRIEDGLFFLQQAVEKALKSILIKKKKELIKTHDLIFLGRLVGLPKELLNYCEKITLAYSRNRYPDLEVIKINLDELDNYINQTREILEWVEKNI
jgi:HEPN domain-containing protein